jgi:hypothetical protein
MMRVIRYLGVSLIMASIIVPTTNVLAGGTGVNQLPVGTVGTGFRLASGLLVTLHGFQPATHVLIRPGGPPFRPARGDVFKYAIWSLRNQGTALVHVGAFFSISGGKIREARVTGNAGFGGLLQPGEVESVSLLVELRRADTGALVGYSSSFKPIHFVAEWRAR